MALSLLDRAPIAIPRYDSPLLRGYRYLKYVKREWPSAAIAAEIAVKLRTGKYKVPNIVDGPQITSPSGTEITFTVDTARIGKTTQQLENKMEIVAAVFRSRAWKIERLTPSRARITLEWETPSRGGLHYAYPDANETQALSAQDGIDLERYPLDLDMSKGGYSTISLTKSVLIGGESESGKSNLVWSILSDLNGFQIPYRLTVIDPAGGVELNDLQQGIYTRRYVDRAKDVDKTINDFHQDMDRRLAWMKANRIRKHRPNHARPLEVMVIDELLLLGNILKGGALSPFGEILSVGRKARCIVIACSQLGQKDVIGQVRDLFVQRACLRTRTQETTDAVLGTGATNDGAKCHRIGQPGIGYVWTDSSATFQRFQAPLILETESIAEGNIAPPAPKREQHRTLRKRRSEGRTFVYKLFDEPHTRRPCYVGTSDNPKRRFVEHKNHPSGWFDSVILSKTIVTAYPTRAEAEDMETRLIEYWAPKYNVMGM